MAEQLVIDYAWQHPNPAAIAAAGYKGVLRYLSGDSTKNLSTAEAASLLAVFLWILLVWETTATRATGGSAAGVADALQANDMADALGYPANCSLFFAVDEQVAWSAVEPYFGGAVSVSRRAVLPYGSNEIIDGFFATFGGKGWQTAAWSSGEVSSNAALYQRVTPTLPPIAGAAGEYDENVILSPLTWWGGSISPQPQEEDVAILTLAPNPVGQPLDIPSTPGVAEAIVVSFDAISNGLSTCALRVAAHKDDGSDGWIQPPVTQGTEPQPLGFLADGTVTVTKGWPITITIPVGCDSVSLRNQGAVDLTVRV